MMKRVLGAAGVGVLVSCLGAVAACGTSSSDEENAQSAKAALESANVAIDLFDANGSKVGEGAGVLIAPNLVLTSAHLIAGKAKWTITTADGKKTVNGTRGLTYDWMKYDSLKSHPRKHDIGVIYLDSPVQLANYPKLASAKAATGTQAMRVQHLGGNFALVGAKLATVRNFPHAYTAEMSNSETVNTGGAVIDEKGDIVGIVTGRGMQTSKVYIARTDSLVQWLSPKVVCAGGKSALSVRTYGAPPPKPGCDAGTGTSGGTSGTSGGTSGTSGGTSGTSGGTSGTSGGTSGTSGGTSGTSGGTSGTSGSSGSDGTCDDGGGTPWGGGGGGGSTSGGTSGTSGGTSGTSGGTSGTSGSSGSDGTTSGGTSGTSGGTSGTSGTTSGGTSGTSGGTSGTSGGTSGTSGTSGSDGTTSGGTSGTSGGTSGAGGTSGTSGTSGSDTLPPGSSSGSSGSGGTGDEEVCEGPSDNPEECPPEATGCEGADCGGSNTTDFTIDYGNCACSSSVGGGSLPVIR
jgi:hypothetical protein